MRPCLQTRYPAGIGPPVYMAKVGGTPIIGVPIIGAPIMGAPAIGGAIIGAPIIGAPITGAPITGAPITGAPITGAPMTGAPIIGGGIGAYIAEMRRSEKEIINFEQPEKKKNQYFFEYLNKIWKVSARCIMEGCCMASGVSLILKSKGIGQVKGVLKVDFAFL